VDKIVARIKGQFAGHRNKNRQIGKQLYTHTHTHTVLLSSILQQWQMLSHNPRTEVFLGTL